MADNIQIMQNLYSLVENEMFLGDRLSTGEFAAVLNPGQFVSPNLLEKPGADDMYIQYDLVNQALDTCFLARSLPATISQKYNEVLYFAALPKSALSQQDSDRLEFLRRATSDWEAAYKEYEGRYSDVSWALEQEQNRPSPSPARLQRLQQQVEDALNEWDTQGHKTEYDDAMAEFRQLLSGKPTTFWDDLRKKFKAVPSAHRGNYYPTYFVPPVADWPKTSTSWSRLDRAVDDSHSTAVSRSTSWSGGASVGWGLWSFGASAGGSTSYQHTDSDTSKLSISLEYLRVRIERPWLVPDVFSYHFWQFNKSHGKRYLSDGGNLNVAPPARPIGDMPFLPTHMVVVRNVKLTANFGHNDQTFIASQFHTNASFGYGPFSLSGSYSESNSQQRVNGYFESGTLTIENPQIFGFIGTLLPKSPDPDLSLPWSNDVPAPDAPLGPQGVDFAFARLQDRAALLERNSRNAAIRASLRQAELMKDSALKKARAERMSFLADGIANLQSQSIADERLRTGNNDHMSRLSLSPTVVPAPGSEALVEPEPKR